jgi:dihydrofolate reductase
MPKHRKIIVYIATSADGFIARKDGAVDWLDRPETAGDYGMMKFFKSIDTILWGRKTYDTLLKFQKEGKAAPDMYGPIKSYAFSRKPPKKVIAGFEFVTEPIDKFARRLRTQKGKDIWMMGGGGSLLRFWMPARSTSSSFTSFRHSSAKAFLDRARPAHGAFEIAVDEEVFGWSFEIALPG